MSRPVIGITSSVEPIRYGAWNEPAAFNPSVYHEAVQRGGGHALMLVPDPAYRDDPDEVLDLLDGLLLTGGTDVDPASYGAQRDPAVTVTTPERDAYELALARRALERDLPLLGICRGMQVLNVARGGSLVQHLPDVLGTEEHRRTVGAWAGNEHEVALEPGSAAARLAGETVHRTFSHHHQAVDALGAGLVVSGRAPFDGLVEAIEDPGRRLAVGVQWHPEVDPGSPVVAAFVREVAALRDAQAAVRPRPPRR
ncbi:gamma-glutamyl-gamma-aminobutyrate hydrolase family protein [Conexibacter sp. W3-3-2]|uniref:gamma-glutamyl-gamma-aminobutyrate hydrolase family protein n=1 Tax=Conexibacter sp. W3-3-2 TaxID=2675227 RepID=UPI001326451D|nr:gamma-glutamyl-gamma-aminobutyrate hydrolase family protein [Conexibacter sp. W3-3-2]MTD47100.1 gamma-glutamyl-gamma-aminobutyrate hydrolase family protein [Conexibacter sp. W3-3-2]